jgi:tRNA/tmRNA/rRNA uracil-C5-methylase (TrmA/RlmC/RlmD family)
VSGATDDEQPRELAITGFANGGAGVAREDGRVVFVAGALPGERVRARVERSQARYAQARVVDVLEASPHRIAPLCPAAAAGAGCCDLAHVDPAHARELRAGALSDVLARIGGLELPGRPVLPLADRVTGVRVRTRLAVGEDGAVGLRVRGGAELITERCAGPDPALLADAGGLGADPGGELVLALGSDGRRHAAGLGRLPDGEKRRAGRRGAQSARARRTRPRPIRLLDGEELVTQRVGGRTWRVPVTGFWQAHRAAPETYAATVAEFAGGALGDQARGLRVWDLYGGVGTLGAALADRAAAIDLVETDPAALAAAGRALADLPVTAHRGDVAAVLPGLARPDLVIADPPRRGAGAGVIAAVAAAGPRAVLHVGCDAASFARDLRDWSSHGYRVLDWRAFDAFGMTHHVEAIAVLGSP